MSKLIASTYRIISNTQGRSIVEFTGANRSVAVEFPTVALMGLAHQLREAAHSATIPLTRRRTTGQMRLIGPAVPPLEDTCGSAPPDSQFGVELSADFELITTWFNIPNTQGSGGTRFEMASPIEDAEKLAADLTKAVAVAQTKPTGATPTTKH
jgi:hypothetical protein